MAKCSEHGIRMSCMNPAFLNSNSTSHTWPFSAVAELVDNASDPGVCAKQMWIDVVEEKGQLCLTFTDNGCGMTPNKLHKMLSFGFTQKGSGKASHQAIGVYGNGFKSGSMRLGRDALIFTKNGGCQSVGMMSQSYLDNINAQAVIVPIVPFNQHTKSQVTTEDSENSLKAILENSIVTSVEEIHQHFDSIPSKKGTKILIWNIRRNKDGKPEMDFETDATDFRLPPIQIEEIKKGLRRGGSMNQEQDIPEIQYSLRAYLSILYLKPRTQIILRGKKNVPSLIFNGLNNVEHDVYSPHFSKDKVKVTFGMAPRRKEHYGIMLYHKNRLIKAYEKVGCQLKTSGQRAGGGVIGVIECNFLKPAHNKQDFEYTKEYRLTLSALGIKLNEYWKAQSSRRAGTVEEESASDKRPMLLQCEECLKWRSVPPGHYEHVPESWTCSQNPNSHYRSCSVPEEAEEEPSAPSYTKQELKKCRKRKALGNCEKVQLDEDKTLSQSSSETPRSVLQSWNSSLHTSSADGQKDNSQQTEIMSRVQWKESKDFTWSRKAVPHVPEHLSLPRADEGKRASDGRDLEEGDEAGTEKGGNKRRAPVIVERYGNTSKEELGEDRKHDQRPGGEEGDDGKDSADSKGTTSHKRKLEPSASCISKKTCLLMRDAENTEGRNPEERSAQGRVGDGGGSPERDERPGDTPQSGPLSPDVGDRAGGLQTLARLEEEVQRLRRLLGLQVHGTAQDTTTKREKATGSPVTPSSQEIGCQTDVAKSSPSSCSLAQVSGNWADLERSVAEQPEQSRTRRKMETPSWRRSSEGDGRSPQECLRLIRSNVVVLLTALLPQVDLSGISMDTSDVDGILQQIIDVNSL